MDFFATWAATTLGVLTSTAILGCLAYAFRQRLGMALGALLRGAVRAMAPRPPRPPV